MSAYSKKFVTSFLRDSVNVRPLSLVRLFETPLQEVKVVPAAEPNFDTHTAVNINPYTYTLEEQLVLYPTVIIHPFTVSQNIAIDVE